jgi:hypothetical protein
MRVTTEQAIEALIAAGLVFIFWYVITHGDLIKTLQLCSVGLLTCLTYDIIVNYREDKRKRH